MSNKTHYKVKNAKKFKRFQIIVGILLLLAVFEFSFIKMSIANANYPKKIAALQEEKETLINENDQLHESVTELGNYDNKKGLENSWERLKEKLETAVEATNS